MFLWVPRASAVVQALAACPLGVADECACVGAWETEEAFNPAVFGLKAADPVHLLARFGSDQLQQRFAPRFVACV